jgi:hypothetical protein
VLDEMRADGIDVRVKDEAKPGAQPTPIGHGRTPN